MNKEQRELNIFKNKPIFNNFINKNIDKIKNYKKGDILQEINDDVDSIYIVVDGGIKCEFKIGNDNFVKYSYKSTHSFLNDILLSSNNHKSPFRYTVDNDSAILKLSYKEFNKFVSNPLFERLYTIYKLSKEVSMVEKNELLVRLNQVEILELGEYLYMLDKEYYKSEKVTQSSTL